MDYLSVKDVQSILHIGDTKARLLMRSMPHLLIGSALRVERKTFEREMVLRTIIPEEKKPSRKQILLREDLIARNMLTPDGKIQRDPRKVRLFE